MPSDSPSSAEETVSAAAGSAAESDTAGSVAESDTPDSAAESDATDSAAESHRAVEWGPVRFERLRSLALGATVTAGGLVLAALLFVGVGVAASLLGGEGPPSSTWAMAVVLFVGGPMSLLYWVVAYDRTSPERRRELLSQFGDYSFDPARFRAGWTVAGAGAVLAVAVAAIGPGPFSASPSLFSGFAPMLVSLFVFLPMMAGSRGTDLRLDPTAGTIERTDRSHDRTRSDDLGAVVRTRRIDLPWATVFLLAYRGNAWYRSTPWLFVPTELADDIERGIEEALARSDGPDRASVPERVILAILGSASLVVGVTMAVATGEGAAGALLTLLTAPFSLLFLALAARL
ncbi:hypothetical protein DJ82_12370 [Halorubrum sp. Ib24]|uniref:hypothetical protein n=1 Tax=Halorubrum sp. Ib24 TaxID=1383850 RepID=UPI000B994044|nr:hypothetical protein [Halorubrum sp. Ib24]OYR38370.1 hypothetical protein DJ82_12370 [Halorubrum sp. Ib24]